ncbi:uncharacterized protein LOC114356567 [Ostrinia furnacalis]|uniref:uncharacterized protein LOC114356567 n=1 Tax=Ostrinia furnacalis TaxID=93504 RepID=UPI00103CAAAB|nr:uncharacterized protein LOC114356567 [Ostrinia furnacalis]
MKKRKSKTKNIRSMATRTKYTHVSYLTTLPEDSPYCATCDMRFLTTEALRKHVSVSPCHGHPAEEPFKPGKRARLDENDAESTKKKSVTCEQPNNIHYWANGSSKKFHHDWSCAARIQILPAT